MHSVLFNAECTCKKHRPVREKVTGPVVGAIDRCDLSFLERIYVGHIISTWTRKSIRCVRFPKTKAGLGCVLSVREMSYFCRSDTVQRSFTRLGQVLSIKAISIWLESIESSGYLCMNIIFVHYLQRG